VLGNVKVPLNPEQSMKARIKKMKNLMHF